MTYTFFDLLKDICAALGLLTVFTASDGSETMAEDAARAGHGRDHEWRGGTLFVLAAGGAAPQGEWAPISGYRAQLGQFSVLPVFSAAIAAGDILGLAAPDLPLGALAELANAGLQSLGEIEIHDSASLTSGAAAYSLPPTIGRFTGVALGLPNGGWQPLRAWMASAGSLMIHQSLPAGRPLRLTSRASHPRLALPEDALLPAIAPDLAVAAGAEQALRWLASRQPNDADLAARWEEARARKLAAQAQQPPRLDGRRARSLMSGAVAWD